MVTIAGIERALTTLAEQQGKPLHHVGAQDILTGTTKDKQQQYNGEDSVQWLNVATRTYVDVLAHHEVLRLCAVLASSSHVSTRASQGRVEDEEWTSEEARREGQGGRGRSSSSIMNLTDPVSRETHIRTHKNTSAD